MRTSFVLASLGIACATLTAAAAPDKPAVERRLHLAQVEASTFLFNDWNKFQENYHPLYVGDDDPATAWVEGAAGPGINEWIRLKVTPMEGASRVRLRVRNGYQKSARLFAANARIKEVAVKLLPGGAVQQATLADAEGWQEIVVEQPAGRLDGVELRALSIYPGKKYEDLCLSDLQLYATSTTPDNPAFEKARLDKILAWKKERAQAARLFKSAAARSMPIGPQYAVDAGTSHEPEAGGDCKWNEPLCKMRAVLRLLGARPAGERHRKALDRARRLLDDKLAGLRPVQVVSEDKRPIPRVDGLCVPELSSCDDLAGCGDAVELPLAGNLGYLDRAQLGVFDVKDSPGLLDALAANPPACKKRNETQYHWAAEEVGADGKKEVSALLVVRCGAVESREGTEPAARGELLVFGSDGRLELSVATGRASTFEWRAGEGGPRLTGAYRMGRYGEPARTLREAGGGTPSSP